MHFQRDCINEKKWEPLRLFRQVHASLSDLFGMLFLQNESFHEKLPFYIFDAFRSK